MWWITKNGALSGPFSKEQIEKRIGLGMIGSLDRVSEDRRTWTYIRDSEFWHQERTIPENLPPPSPVGGRKIGLVSRRTPASATVPVQPVLDKPDSSGEAMEPPILETEGTTQEGQTASQTDECVSPDSGESTLSFSIWKLIFGGVFRRHGEGTIASILNGDGRRALPEGFYPKTWLWSRVWLWSTILAGITLALAFGNPRIIPGFIMLAAFGTPVAIVLFFLECDVTRCVSIWKTMGVFIAGGVFSLLATTIFTGTNIGATLNGALGPGSAGPIEESAKLLILLPFLANSRRYPSVLNGLLLGAAVGAGFAAFETAGYVFNDAFMAALVNGSGLEDALGESLVVAIMRAVLAPFMHIAWTASVGGALWKARGESGGIGAAFTKISAWGVIVLAMLLHLLWNWGLGGFSLLGLAPWAIIVHHLAHGYGRPNAGAQVSVAPSLSQGRSGMATGAVVAISILAAVIGALAVLFIAVAISDSDDNENQASPVPRSTTVEEEMSTTQDPFGKVEDNPIASGDDGFRGCELAQLDLSRYNSKYHAFLRYITPSYGEVKQAFGMVANSEHVEANLMYKNATDRIRLYHDPSDGAINAFATRFDRYRHKGTYEIWPTIVVQGGAGRFSRIIGAALADDKELDDLLAALGGAGTIDNALALRVLSNGLNIPLERFSDEAWLAKAKNISRGILLGILAHETGHIVLGHVWSWGAESNERSRNQERQADSFAHSVASGTADADIMFFGNFVFDFAFAINEGKNGDSEASRTHPYSEERLFNLLRDNRSTAIKHGFTEQSVREMLNHARANNR